MFDSEEIKDDPSEKMIGFRYYVYRILAKKGSTFKHRFLEQEILYWHNAIRCLRLSEKLVISHERNMLDLQEAKWEFLQTNYEIYEKHYLIVVHSRWYYQRG